MSGFRWRNALKIHWNFSCLLLFALLLGQQVSAQGTQTTLLINPNAEGGFETGTTFASNGWTTVNATTNTWNVGTVPGWFTGTGGAYVSNNSGGAWAYTNTAASRSHFYRDITFPAGVTAVNLAFDWRGNGNDGNYDNLLVYLVDTTVTPDTAGPTGTNTTAPGWTGYTDGTTGYYLLQRNGTANPTTTTNITYSLTAAQRTYVAGKTKRLVFVWKNDTLDGTSPPASVDNISLTAVAPTCLIPSNITATAVATQTATINWTASGSAPANGYEYEVRTSGAAGSGTTGLTVANTTAAGVTTANISGLTSAVTYSVYVRANCGSGDFSAWTAAGTFTTLCSPSAIPHIVPIEAVTVPAIPACTTVQNVNNDTRTWISYAPVTGITGKVMGYPYHGSNAANDWFFTNGLELTQGVSYRLKFKYKDTAFAEKLKVGIGTTAVNTAMTTTLFDVTTGTGTTVVAKEIDFTVPTTGVYNIGFQCYSAANMNILYVGEIAVEVTPSCLVPTAVNASAITMTTATIGWTAPATAPANGYQYEVRSSGAAGSGATGLAASGNTAAGVVTANVATLTQATVYTVYVRSACGATDFSAWTAAYTFTTVCDNAVIPYTVPIEAVTVPAIPMCTTVQNVNNDTRTWVSYATTTGITGKVMGYPYHGTNAADDWFFTNGLNLTQGVSYRLKFKYKDSGYAEKLKVAVGTTAVNTAMTTTLFDVTTGTGTTVVAKEIDFTAPATGVYNIGFQCYSVANMSTLYLGEITVELAPTCLPASATAVSAITKNTATISWTASTSAPASGYEYEIRTSGAAGSGATGLATSGTTAAGIVTKNVTGLLPSTAYAVYVRANCGAGDFSTWTAVTNFTTSCDYFDITGTTPATICGQGTANLGVTTTGGTVKWYAAATGGTALATGATYTTPVINATTSYWAETSVLGTPVSVGPASPTAQGGTIGVQTTAWNVNFTVTQNTALASVDVFPVTSGQAGAIVVRSSTGTVIATYPYTTNVSGGATAQTITLNHVFAPGSYQLYPTLPTAGLSRNTTGAVYPYTSSVANITGNGYDAAYFMSFYNWVFQSSCVSPRTEVVATVTTPPTFALSTNSTTAVCSGQAAAAVTIATGAADYDTFVWSPATGVTGNAANGWVFNPTATTTYTLTASQSAGACTTTANVVVNINPLPVVAASAANATVCEGTSTTLSAITIAPGTVAIGTGTTLTSATTQPTAFCNRFDQYWNQTVYTAAELTAAGLKAGNITSIAYNITTLGDAANVTNFTIRIGTTANSTLTAFTTTGLNLVYGPSTYAHAVGVNTITFATPYVWDGVSNIIVDVRHDGVDATNNSITYYTTTTGNMTISAVSSTPSSTTVLSTTNPTGTVSTQRLNVVFGGQVVSTGAGTIDWTWTPGNLTGSTVTVSPATTTTYTVRGTNSATGCYAESTVTVNVTSTPAPTGNSTQTINANTAADATIENIVVTGTAVVWYPTSADALANTNPIAAGTQLVSGTTYYAMQTVGGCRSVSPLAVTVTVTLGTSSFDIVGLKYYPNPVVDVFTVTYTDAITSVEVFNLVGQRVIAVKPNTNTALLDMSTLPTGAYILQVKANGQSQSIKVIKK
ncbi:MULTISPECIES: fibronectin type III domain-containing protein [unclassified Flavobacterium]|uniref:beta strand repeat-containing protein n=1 Tax=unclassified Flavobacterium TaxID=196869 RepID=UPI001AC5BF94|nr:MULTISPECIES: fibronectin type III domain-containing protein [unclassified Flavobacterium]MBN9283227.1 fibronectin type III domain-containing protein [Flavobacterium sp.]